MRNGCVVLFWKFEDSACMISDYRQRSRVAPNEMGWKDTVRVNTNEIVRVIARFEDFTGKYPYHCPHS